MRFVKMSPCQNKVSLKVFHLFHSLCAELLTNSHILYLQVDYGRDHTLFALREGHVKITKELVERPHWCEWGEGPYFERTFLHVEERPKLRRIVCQNPEVLRDLDT